MPTAFELPALYPIVDVRGDRASVEALERAHALAVALADAGITLIQLRAKALAAGPLTELACSLVASLETRGCRLVVNDRVDAVLASGAAGVHLGEEDLPVAAARELLGAESIVGYSTHAIDDIRRAPAGASYLGFGPVFESPTKAGAREPRGLDRLAAACRATPLPVAAIGGVTLATAPDVWAAGAASCAVISEIERASDVAALVRAWLVAAAARR